MANRNKVGTPINTGIEILTKLAELGGKATAKDLGVTNNPLHYLAKPPHGVVKVATKNGVEVTRLHTDAEGNPQRGRPMKVWTLTDKGRKRVKRRQAEAQVAA